MKRDALWGMRSSLTDAGLGERRHPLSPSCADADMPGNARDRGQARGVRREYTNSWGRTRCKVRRRFLAEHCKAVAHAKQLAEVSNESQGRALPHGRTA